jgi:hypothetical protein
VTKQLLYATKVRAAVQKMSRRTVPKSVRTERRQTINAFERQMYYLPDLSLVDPASATPEKCCGRRIFPKKLWSSPHHPVFQGGCRRHAIGDNSLLTALSEDAHRSPVVVQVIHIQTAKFTHSDACGVQQFEHRNVTEGCWLRSDDLSPSPRSGQGVLRLIRLEHLGQ